MVNSVDTQKAVNTKQYAPDTKIDAKGARVGQGSSATSGETPPLEQPTKEAMAGALASLDAFLSGNGSVDVEVLLVQVTVAMRDTEAGNQKAKINTDQEAKKAQMKEKEAKLEEAQRKMDEAEAKKKSGSLIDKIKLAFEWIAAAIAIAVAVVMIATGVGAVVGAMLIAAAVTSLVMAVDSTVQAATGKGIAGNLAMAFGASEEEAAKADMGFRISLAVLGIAFAIGSGGAGAVSAARSAVSAGVKAADTARVAGETAVTVAKQAANAAKSAFTAALRESSGALTQGAKLARGAASTAEATQAAGAAATDIARNAVQYEETNLRAEAKKLESEAKSHEAMMQMLDDLIDQALARLMASSDRFNLMLDDITETMADRGNTLSRARFAG
jgi:hypothetical protein